MSPRDSQLDAIQEILLGEIRELRALMREQSAQLADIRTEVAGMKVRAGMAGSALGFIAGFVPMVFDKVIHKT